MTMTLSAEDRDWIRLTAKDLAFHAMTQVLSQHVQACPHGKRVIINRIIILTVTAVTSAAFGAGVAFAKIMPKP